MHLNSVDRARMKSTVFILPAFLLHFFIITLPAFTLVYYSFTEWNGIGKPVYIGFDNFKRMLFEDLDLHFAFLNNIVWTLIFLTVPIVMGLLVALLVIRLQKTQMFFRTVYFTPYVISSVIAGKIFSVYYSPYSGIPQLLKNIGLPSVDFLGNTKTALFSVAFVDNWHWWGFVMVLFLSALQQVDPYLYEAANIEGANPLIKLLKITLPSILPTLVTLYMLTIIGSFLSYDYVWVMTNGGPAGATEMVSTWIYKRFTSLENGYASTLSFTICMICVGIYFAFKSLQKRGLDI